MQLIEKIQSFQAFLPGGEETFGAILMHKRIKFPTTDNWLGKGSQEQLDWSRQTLESTTRTLFQPPLSSSAATTNFGSRLLIELVREDTDWIGVGHCSKKLEIFFFFTRYFSSFWPALANSDKMRSSKHLFIFILLSSSSLLTDVLEPNQTINVLISNTHSCLPWEEQSCPSCN